MNKKIRFSHYYFKMPRQETTEKGKHTIIGIQIYEDIYKLPEEFLNYDASFWNGTKSEQYPIPLGKGIVIFIFSSWENDYPIMWSTIRRWTLQKEKYYKGLIGKDVEIAIEEAK